MEYFDFLHLPILVQELIVDKIVHHSPPEDRIRFASSCKYFNELVQNAKPKKIIEYLHLEFDLDFKWESTSTLTTNNSMEELKNILTKCQVRTLGLFICWNARGTIWDNPEFWTTLFEASKFVTKLDIHCYAPYDTHAKKFVELYEIMKDLNQIKINSDHRFLHKIPYYPPTVEISCDFPQGGALEVLDCFAEKTKNRPLSFLSLRKHISFEAFQQFLT
uniref:F-box domain-containing protein n=1 Tax=Panagrolaimus sp. JU765 TaxID=591449 RepID=A0AC34RPH2_9BILA